MTPTDRAVRPHLSARSGSRAAGERCSALPRSPAGVIVPASIGLPLAWIGWPLQVERVDSRLRLALDAAGSGAYSSCGATLWPSPRMYVSHDFSAPAFACERPALQTSWKTIWNVTAVIG